MSTARCYLDPIRKRANLQSRSDALAEALLLDGHAAVAYATPWAEKSREAHAAREVVVSAGTINSPQLLELSGIGQPERLRSLGIEVRHALPGVGENLRDHFAPRTRWAVGARASPSTTRAAASGLVAQALRYALFQDGMLGSVAAPIRAFVRSREGLEAPDVLLGWVPMLTEPGPKGPKISRQSGMTCYAHPMRPESKGRIHITSSDPKRPPAINFNFLSSPVDADITVRAVRIARSVMTAPAMARLQVSEIAPGTARTSDDEIIDWVKSAAETTYHPVGTCKMGTDPMAVVDPQLRVHGIAGLRVADASIMPTLTSGNTNAPSIMIGEKAADMVLRQAAGADYTQAHPSSTGAAMPTDADAGLSPAQTQDFRRLAGMMIPPSDEYAVPGADDATIFADILRSLGRDAGAVRGALTQLAGLADSTFAELDATRREKVAETFLASGSPEVAILGRVILQCYYRDDRVVTALGLEPRAPFPKGHTLEQGDWSLLDAVRGRPKMWRDAP